MSSFPILEPTRDDRFDRTIPDYHPAASVAGLSHNTASLLPYTTACTPTFMEDARALLSGNADHLLGFGNLVDVAALSGIDQSRGIIIHPHITNVEVASHPNGQHVTPHVSLPQLQLQPQVPFAPIVPPANIHVQHVTVTTPRQCPYGCTNIFGRPGEYNRHMKKHNGPFFPYTHPHCGKMFHRQDKLRNHLNKGH